MILASREDIAEQAWLRDEPEVARAVLDCDDTTHRRIMDLAAAPRTGGILHNQVDQLLVAAAVQVIAGTKRKPRSWRARSEDLLPQFWAEVGPERDRRAEWDPADQISKLMGELPGDGAEGAGRPAP